MCHGRVTDWQQPRGPGTRHSPRLVGPGRPVPGEETHVSCLSSLSRAITHLKHTHAHTHTQTDPSVRTATTPQKRDFLGAKGLCPAEIDVALAQAAAALAIPPPLPAEEGARASFPPPRARGWREVLGHGLSLVTMGYGLHRVMQVG